MHYRLYSCLSKYITISANNIYLALLLFLCAKMCLFSIVGAGLMALSAFIDSRRLRLSLPFAFMLIYLPFWADDLFLMGYFLVAFICNMLFSEYIRRTADTEASRASLIVLVFAATQLLLIDFSMHQTRNGFLYTFVSGRYDHCMYRIFSIFLIAESARLFNMFIRSLKVSSLIVFNSLFALSFINYWVYAITGKTFIFSDLHLAGTAAGVFEGVQIKTNDILFFALYVTLVVIFNLLFIRIDLAVPGRKKRQKRGFLALALLIIMSVLSIGGLLSPLMYNSAVRLGFPSHLIININDSLKPSHYDEFLKKLLFSEEQAMPAAKGPNIIVIMSESFSDLKEVGEFETNRDYMPYIRSIMEDYPSGILYSSVIGNNTCSSEYEFLTGVPTALTESGATIYQRYMKETEPSLVSLLEAQNYHTVGIHPYKSSGYNRKNAWEAFGFDEMHFEEDFDKAWNVRGFTSDQSFYKKIIESYESKPNQPMFCFGISMQNHATYLTDYMGDVHLTGEYRDKYPDVDEYLSLLKVTDDDTKALIDYFSAVEEETMIVFFGDHQPMIDKQFYSDILGEDITELSSVQNTRTYRIPYFVWTNYDAEIEVPKEASINYLPNILLEAADIGSNDWFTFTGELYNSFPVVTGNFIKVDGRFKDTDELMERVDDIRVSEVVDPYYKLKEFRVGAYSRAIGQ